MLIWSLHRNSQIDQPVAFDFRFGFTVFDCPSGIGILLSGFGFVVPNLIGRCARFDRFFFFFVVTLAGNSDGIDQLMAKKPCSCKAERENKTSSASVRISAKSRRVFSSRLGKVQSGKPHPAQAVADEKLGPLIGQALFKIRILNIKT